MDWFKEDEEEEVKVMVERGTTGLWREGGRLSDIVLLWCGIGF